MFDFSKKHTRLVWPESATVDIWSNPSFLTTPQVRSCHSTQESCLVLPHPPTLLRDSLILFCSWVTDCVPHPVSFLSHLLSKKIPSPNLCLLLNSTKLKTSTGDCLLLKRFNSLTYWLMTCLKACLLVIAFTFFPFVLFVLLIVWKQTDPFLISSCLCLH